MFIIRLAGKTRQVCLLLLTKKRQVFYCFFPIFLLTLRVANTMLITL